jgi:hypothetical protein
MVSRGREVVCVLHKFSYYYVFRNEMKRFSGYYRKNNSNNSNNLKIQYNTQINIFMYCITCLNGLV